MQRMARGDFNRSALDRLTAREHEIVELVKQGISNKMIAYELNLSENTILKHLSNIMEKLKSSNRMQVATLAWKDDHKRR